MNIKRGDIWYIENGYATTGSEQRPGRPAVVVSNDRNNQSSRTVEVEAEAENEKQAKTIASGVKINRYDSEVTDMNAEPMIETMELMTKQQNVPGYASNVFVNRVYIKLGGKWVETCKTVDCPRHLMTADRKRHFCVGHNDTIKELPPVAIPFLCGHVCDEMKLQFLKAIEEYGAYLTESEKQHMQDYIAKENTVEWDNGFKEDQ